MRDGRVYFVERDIARSHVGNQFRLLTEGVYLGEQLQSLLYNVERSVARSEPKYFTAEFREPNLFLGNFTTSCELTVSVIPWFGGSIVLISARDDIGDESLIIASGLAKLISGTVVPMPFQNSHSVNQSPKIDDNSQPSNGKQKVPSGAISPNVFPSVPPVATDWRWLGNERSP